MTREDTRCTASHGPLSMALCVQEGDGSSAHALSLGQEAQAEAPRGPRHTIKDTWACPTYSGYPQRGEN